ncbi:Predicted membrane protein [Serratia fonticola]|uniref:Predicted membrane protein n=1 Tax=Serratia fonticola TaxID=47917 RepID=A0A4U9UAK9_SERFO|nr:Predicted membrane protein [Serratia fonticola]
MNSAGQVNYDETSHTGKINDKERAVIDLPLSIKHYWQVRPRLLISVGAGLVCVGLLPAHLPWLQRLIVGWNVMAWIYLLCLWHLMLGCTPQRTRQLARKQDESASQVLALVSLGCVVSILAILFELSTAKQVSDSLKTLHLALTGSTLVVSWLLLPTAFTMHYAHLFLPPAGQYGGVTAIVSRQADRAKLLGLRLFLLHHCRGVTNCRRGRGHRRRA